MPPKQSQWNNPMLPHHTVPSMSFSSMSVEDILAHYEPTSDLSEHILLAKEQEEKVGYIIYFRSWKHDLSIH